MLTVDDLMQMDRPTETVTLGGREWTIRALVAAERQAIDAAWPPPAAPMFKDINTGAQGRDLDSPKYLAERQERFQALTCAVVAIALDFGIGSPAETFPFTADAARRKAWIKGAADELGRWFTDKDLEHLYDRISRLEQSRFTLKDRIGGEGATGN